MLSFMSPSYVMLSIHNSLRILGFAKRYVRRLGAHAVTRAVTHWLPRVVWRTAGTSILLV